MTTGDLEPQTIFLSRSAESRSLTRAVQSQRQSLVIYRKWLCASYAKSGLALHVPVPPVSTRSTNVLLPRIRSGLNATNSAAKRCERPSDCAAEPHNELPPSHTCPPEVAMRTAYRGQGCEGIRTAGRGDS